MREQTSSMGIGFAMPNRTRPSGADFRTATAYSNVLFDKSSSLTNINLSPGIIRPSACAKPPGTNDRITITDCPGCNGSYKQMLIEG